MPGYSLPVSQLERDVRHCPACGTSLGIDQPVCPGCGATTGGDTMQFPAVSGPAALPVEGAAVVEGGVPAATRPFTSPLVAAFLVVLAALLVALAVGQWLMSLLLVPIAVTLGVAAATVALQDVEAPVDRFLSRMADNLWQTARMARVSAASWARSGRAQLSIQSRQRALRRTHETLMRQLGEAIYRGDEEGAAAVKATAAANGIALDECAAALRAAKVRATVRIETERVATAPTEVFTAVGRDTTSDVPGSGPTPPY